MGEGRPIRGLARTPTAKLVLASFLAGAGWMFSIQALQGVSPIYFIATRFLLAGLLIGLTTGFLAQRGKGRILRNTLPGAALLGLSMTFWTIGLSQTSNPGVSSFITAAGNLFVPVWGLVIFGWKIHQSTALALCISLAGLALLLIDPGGRFEPAQLLFLAAAGLWALSMTLVKNQLIGASSAVITASLLTLSGAMMLVMAILVEGVPNTMAQPRILLWFLASLLLSTYLRFLLQFSGQSAVSLSRAGLIMSLEPVWVLIFSILLFTQTPAGTEAIGCALVLCALVFDTGRARLQTRSGKGARKSRGDRWEPDQKGDAQDVGQHDGKRPAIGLTDAAPL